MPGRLLIHPTTNSSFNFNVSLATAVPPPRFTIAMCSAESMDVADDLLPPPEFLGLPRTNSALMTHPAASTCSAALLADDLLRETKVHSESHTELAALAARVGADGRIRWRPAPLKQGYERDAQASMLELVPAESVQGVREAEGEVWCVDDLDVEQAAREQAAAARNKRRALVDEGMDDATFAAFGEGMDVPLGLTRSGNITRSGGGGGGGGYLGLGFGGGLPKPPKKKREGSHRRADGSAPPRKKKRLAPASNSCLACTKGKHCAHTCGVRGKEAEARYAAERAAAAAAAAGLTAVAGEAGEAPVPAEATL